MLLYPCPRAQVKRPQLRRQQVVTERAVRVVDVHRCRRFRNVAESFIRPNDQSSGAFSCAPHQARRQDRRTSAQRAPQHEQLNVDCSETLGKQTVARAPQRPAPRLQNRSGSACAGRMPAPDGLGARELPRAPLRGTDVSRSRSAEALRWKTAPSAGEMPSSSWCTGTSPCCLTMVELSHSSLTPKAQSHSASLQNMRGAPTGAQVRSGPHSMSS
jgi:hypothetical protein